MKLESARALPRNPSGACPKFAQALSSGDLKGAADCFARDGCLITPDATTIHGRDRIRPVLAQLVLSRATIQVEASHVIAAGEVVLARERWKLRSGESEEALIRQTLNTTLVLRRIEGAWKLSIAAPWGWAEPIP